MRVLNFLKVIIIILFIYIVFILALKSFETYKFGRQSFVPNIVHYIIFNNKPLDFITFVSLTSVFKIQKPEEVYIHTNSTETLCKGKYWNSISQLYKSGNINLKVEFFETPSHVYGQRLSSVYHASDVARIIIIYSFGGIYLDVDTIVLKPLNSFFYNDATVACPQNDYVGNQVIIANKYATFLRLWLEGYKRYKPIHWYMNAGQFATELLKKNPHLAHKLTSEFGVQNLLNELYVRDDWEGWKELYTIHLLSRHPPAPRDFHEDFNFKCTFGKILKWILYEQKPTLIPGLLKWKLN